MDTPQIAAAVASILAPFLPYLTEVGKETGKKLAEVIAEKGGQAVWEKAKQLWTKLKDDADHAPAVQGAAIMVAAQPEDEFNRTALARAIGVYLQKNPKLAKELLDLLGGSNSVQEVLADKESLVQRVEQEIEGTGMQRIKVEEKSRAIDVKQRISKSK
jgi:hypothetical protein